MPYGLSRTPGPEENEELKFVRNPYPCGHANAYTAVSSGRYAALMYSDAVRLDGGHLEPKKC